PRARGGGPKDRRRRAPAGLSVPQFAHGAVTGCECRDRTDGQGRPYPLRSTRKETPMKKAMLLVPVVALVMAACSNGSTSTPPAAGRAGGTSAAARGRPV